MNAAFLLMTTTMMAGADPVAPPAAPAPAVVTPAMGCGPDCCGCGTTYAKASFFDKLKAKFATSNSCCATPKPNLIDKIKSRSSKHSCGCAPVPVCDGCSTPGISAPVPSAPPATAPKADPPKDMPIKKADAPKASLPGTSPSTSIPSIPSPGAVLVPALPITPISGPKLNGSTSPY